MKYNIKVLGLLEDSKTDASSILCEISIGSYIKLVQGNLNELDIQRGKMISKKKGVYSRLIEDLKGGALMPSIYLATKENSKINDQLKECKNDLNVIEEILKNNLTENDVVILDGLQRTYCILNIIDEVKENNEKLQQFYNQKIRAEIWYKMTFNSLLYKMIVLNTGQVKMSMKHQLEILNIPLREKIISISKDKYGKDVRFSTFKKPSDTKGEFRYKFSTLVEAYTSFITGEEQVDKTNEVLKELERMRFIEEHSMIGALKDEEIELFTKLLLKIDEKLYKKYSEPLKVDDITPLTLTSRSELLNSAPFLCGFCAALRNSLKRDEGKFNDRIESLWEKLESKNLDPLSLEIMSKILEEEKKDAKRWGNEQRRFFRRAFDDFFRGEDYFERIWERAV